VQDDADDNIIMTVYRRARMNLFLCTAYRPTVDDWLMMQYCRCNFIMRTHLQGGPTKWHPFGIWVSCLVRCIIYFAMFLYSRIIFMRP